ncbi:Lrp/AsnC family transcriptional regulator [Sphingomonas sp.]|uniref:Lrp/AsnC family transcriptional regulator n=1 Tax=Sphingomonas sp. TaxID=28214 RepID=UPI001EB11FFB|nr:Lrp/AsnC family transcriptional regulator [Sphingomonas sp.]MBX3594224.1 Lrp/AsnC family transcriptional regulator [Sphingomonas sp.]
MAKLDDFDLRLLDLLQADALATAEELARHVPLSPSAVTRRVRRLRAEGWIAADVAVPAPGLTAGRLRALVRVQVHEHAEERGIAALRAKLAGTPEVQMLLDVAGADDLAVLICARDMDDYNALTDRLLERDPAVRRYETSFVKRVHKQSSAVALAAAGTGGTSPT